MTLATAKTLARSIGLTLTKHDGEYRVNFQGGKEATAYYTNDIHDALYTAVAMSRSQDAPCTLNCAWVLNTLAEDTRS